MFLMYFIIALVNAVLTFKIREQEKKARDKEKKENTIKLYNTLLNSLSHELRTPIATIIGAIDTLTENRKKLSEQHQDQLLQEMNKASLRLNRQVDNLLNMSRLETGELHLKYDWCDINELIYSLIHKLPEDALHHIIDFSPQDNLPLLKLDIGLMEHVILNIIHNALHYTPQNSIISINTSLEDETLVIVIQDNGKGFPENEIQYAFDKFYRLPQTKGGGTGLGLSIAKGFVLAHQGTIHLKNRTEGGACFTIKIPVETTYLNNLKNE
jgi:two-component system sensor histidine kinase KdpD